MTAPKQAILIGGTARCGSTLTDLMLGNHPQAFSLGEVVRWYRPTRTHHFDIKCACGVYPCPVWRRLNKPKPNRLYGTIHHELGVNTVIDSSKSIAWMIDQNRWHSGSSEIMVINVLLYKDPLSLFYSHWKRGATDPTIHAERYRYYGRVLDARLPFVSINYDWLVSNPVEALPRVCAVLGLEYRPGREQFWKGHHHHLWGSLGPRRQLFIDNPSIYVEQFDPAFLSKASDYTQRFEADRVLSQILREVKNRDIRTIRHAPTASPHVRRRFPYWLERAREIRSRWNPEPFLDYEASLIKEWRV